MQRWVTLPLENRDTMVYRYAHRKQQLTDPVNHFLDLTTGEYSKIA